MTRSGPKDPTVEAAVVVVVTVNSTKNPAAVVEAVLVDPVAEAVAAEGKHLLSPVLAPVQAREVTAVVAAVGEDAKVDVKSGRNECKTFYCYFEN